MNAHSRFAVPDPVMIDRLPLAARFSLRLTMADRGAASAALGLERQPPCDLPWSG
jgi:hypothetical protein